MYGEGSWSETVFGHQHDSLVAGSKPVGWASILPCASSELGLNGLPIPWSLRGHIPYRSQTIRSLSTSEFYLHIAPSLADSKYMPVKVSAHVTKRLQGFDHDWKIKTT